MLRVDVPAGTETPAYTKFYGGTSIYAITPTDEDVVKRAVERLRPRPVENWIVPPAAQLERRLVDSHGHDIDDDDDLDDDDTAPF